MNFVAKRDLSGPPATGPLGAFSRSEARELAYRQNAVVAESIVAGSRIQAKGYATTLAIAAVGLASREAAYNSGGDPQVQARLDLLVDRLTINLANEIGRM